MTTPDLTRAAKYGDGAFETMRLVQGRIPLWSWHYERLRGTCHFLGLEWPTEWTQDGLHSTLTNHTTDAPDARIRLTVWRAGAGAYKPASDTLDYHISVVPLPQRLPHTHPKVLSVVYCDSIRVTPDALSPLKTLNGLPYVLAAREYTARGADEGLLLNTQGRVAEATAANLFWVEDGSIYTPPLSEGALDGVMRRWLLEYIPVTEAVISPDALSRAEEVWLTNSVHGIRSVSRLEDATYDSRRALDVQQQYIDWIESGILTE